MSLNQSEKGRSRASAPATSYHFLPQMWEGDAGVPPPGGDPAPAPAASYIPPVIPLVAPATAAIPLSTVPFTPPSTAAAPLVSFGGGVTPPAVPAPAPAPVVPVSSEQALSKVFTEAEHNNALAQQRAQYDRQVERLKLQNVALATGVAGADVLLEQIDRRSITYDEAGKATNLKDLLLAQRDALAATLGFSSTPAPAATPPVVPPQIPPTNGGGGGNEVPLAEANLFTEGLFRKT